MLWPSHAFENGKDNPDTPALDAQDSTDVCVLLIQTD